MAIIDAKNIQRSVFHPFNDDAEQIFKYFVPNKLLGPLLGSLYIFERRFTREITILYASSATTIDASMTLSEVQ